MLQTMPNYARICSFFDSQRSLQEEIPSILDPTTTGASAEISVWRMFLALIPPLIVIVISYHLKLKITRMIVVSISRTIFQLLLAGYVLLSFIFDMHSPVVVMAYLLVMMLIAAMEATGRQIRTYPGHFWHSLLAIMASGGVIGMYGAVVVYHPSPWWEPHVMVPTAGMIIGNAISGPALAVDRLLADIAEKRHESETRLAFGASRLESVLPTMRSAVLAALLPNLNQMSVVGLVSIPGMMTGQLLSGSTPLVAAEYQMSILWLIFATAAVSTYIAVLLVISQGVFDNDHRLSQGKITKRSEKVSCDGYMYLMGKMLVTNMYSCVKRMCASVVHLGRMENIVGGLRVDMHPMGQGPGYEMVREQSAHGLLSSSSSSSASSSASSAAARMTSSSSSGLPISSIRRNKTATLTLSSHSSSHSSEHSSEVDDMVRVNRNETVMTGIDDEDVEAATTPLDTENGTTDHGADNDNDNESNDKTETNGKVFYTILDNDPTDDYADVDGVLTRDILFEAEGFNVLSGEIPLFATNHLHPHPRASASASASAYDEDVSLGGSNESLTGVGRSFSGGRSLGGRSRSFSGGSNGSLGGLSGINFSLRKGERMSVEGPSGLGKTRLLRAIAQLDPPLSGGCSVYVCWLVVYGWLCRVGLDWVGLGWLVGWLTVAYSLSLFFTHPLTHTLSHHLS